MSKLYLVLVSLTVLETPSVANGVRNHHDQIFSEGPIPNKENYNGFYKNIENHLQDRSLFPFLSGVPYFESMKIQNISKTGFDSRHRRLISPWHQRSSTTLDETKDNASLFQLQKGPNRNKAEKDILSRRYVEPLQKHNTPHARRIIFKRKLRLLDDGNAVSFRDVPTSNKFSISSLKPKKTIRKETNANIVNKLIRNINWKSKGKEGSKKNEPTFAISDPEKFDENVLLQTLKIVKKMRDSYLNYMNSNRYKKTRPPKIGKNFLGKDISKKTGDEVHSSSFSSPFNEDYSTLPLHKLFGPPYDHYRSRHSSSSSDFIDDEPRVKSYALPPSANSFSSLHSENEIPQNTFSTLDGLNDLQHPSSHPSFNNHPFNQPTTNAPISDIQTTPSSYFIISLKKKDNKRSAFKDIYSSRSNSNSVKRKASFTDSKLLLDATVPPAYLSDYYTSTRASKSRKGRKTDSFSKEYPYEEKEQRSIGKHLNSNSLADFSRKKSGKHIKRGKSYPTYQAVPRTSFTCLGRPPGLYADTETGCQVWHTCESDSRQHSFLCPNGTIFNQRILTCDWWNNVECEGTDESLKNRASAAVPLSVSEDQRSEPRRARIFKRESKENEVKVGHSTKRRKTQTRITTPLSSRNAGRSISKVFSPLEIQDLVFPPSLPFTSLGISSYSKNIKSPAI